MDRNVCSLANQKCVPCQGGMPPLSGEALDALAKELAGGWLVVNAHHLKKTFLFADFQDALAFTNRVGALAEEVGHHPDLHLSWGRVTITLWTHKIDGLSETDFVFAAKTDMLVDG